MFKLCVCGHFHCPSCGNQMENDLLCPVCGMQWTGEEEFSEAKIDIFDLLD